MTSIAARRELYRVALDPTAKLGLTLRKGSAELPATIVDLSLHGVAALFSSPPIPDFSECEALDLVFHTASGEVMQVPGHVRHVLGMYGMARVGIQFDEPEDLSQAVPGPLFGLFNRRKTERVEGLSIDCCLYTEDHSLVGRIVDLSGGGAQLLTEPIPEHQVQPESLVSVQFRLGAAVQLLDFEGRVRHTHVVERPEEGDPRHRIGVEFCPERTDMFKEQQEQILLFVDRMLSDS